MHHPRLFPQRLSRLALAAAATCFLSCGLIACGSDADNPSGSTAVDVAGGDSVTAADGEGSDGSTPDTNATDAANADILANDTKTTQTDASDAAVAADKDGGSIADVTSADVATSDAGGDDVGSPDAGEADATTPKPKSCKGTLQCGFYLQMGDAKACAADPGCQMVGTKCVGFATKITCAKAPNQQGCTMALGCAWTDCQVTNGGVEVCDGVDNDCDGVTDNADTPKGGICNDGDLCNGDEPCTAGKCEAAVTALTCPTKLCHSASCDKTKGCVQTPNTNACDDGNACTTEDACNAGLCKGGKNKDCDDKNVCTKDSCSAGKCVHTKINSCVGPTDYQAMSLVGTKASYVGPATLSFSLTVKNEGKAYYGVSSGLLKWELWYSADDKLGTGDTKAMSAKTWSGKNLGIGNGFKNLQGTVGGGFVVTTRASIPKTAKFVCAKLVSASDTNATNNVACAALPTVLWPEYQVKSLKLSVTDIKIGVATKVTVGVQNNGGDSAGVEAVFYASKDMKIDKSDLQAGTGKVGAAKAGALATTELSINLSYKTQAVHKYLCVQVNAKGLALELNQTDNVLCTTMNVINLPDVYVLANQFAFRNKKGAVVGNPKYGEAYGCYASQVYNGGYGAAGEFGVRCWMNKTTAGPTGSLWSESWQHKNGVSAATYTAKKYPGVEKYVYSPTFTNLSKTATLGLHYLCIELNHDKKMSELTYHPKVCRKVNVMGIDLINYPPMTGLKTAKSNTVLPRGQPLYLDYSVCNNGNMQMTGGKAMQSRVLLSKDKNPSADDHLVWSGPYWKDALANGGTKWGGCSGLVAQSFKATLPTSLSPGPMYVIYQVNYDGKFLEPSGNNLTVRAVTIQ